MRALPENIKYYERTELMEILTTVLLGIGTVFAGLVVITLLVMLLRLFAGNKQEASAPAAVPAAPAAPQRTEIANRQEFVAAVSAVLAEELGTDVSAIRIHSIKKI